MVSENAHARNQQLLESALAYASRGWRIIPLHHIGADGACSCGKGGCKPGKHPWLAKWQHRATTDEPTIRGWWRQWPEANIGVRTGPGSDLLVLDPEHEGLADFARLQQQLGELPRSPRVDSGGGGMHYYSLWPSVAQAKLAGVSMLKRIHDLPIDVSVDHQVVAAPSITDKGQYRWRIHPDEAPLAELPPRWVEWVIDGIRKSKSLTLPVEKATPEPPPVPARLPELAPSAPFMGAATSGRPEVRERAIAYLAQCPPAVSGQGGHNTTFAVVRAVFDGFDLGRAEALDLLADWNRRCQPPWSDEELNRKVDQCEKVPYGKPRGWLLQEDSPSYTWPSATASAPPGGPGGAGGPGGGASPSAPGTGGEDIESLELPPPLPWPVLPDAALTGLAGEYVRAIGPASEADPVAVLAQVLAGFGSMVGRGPHLLIEGDKHFANLFVGIVGDTANGRKGTGWGRARQLLELADPLWAATCVRSGLSSSEGLIFHVRDASRKFDPKRGQAAVVDEGVSDKRMLCYEPELAQVLAQFKREGNALSAILRQSWESSRLSTLTRGNPLVATGAHVSLITHVTPMELRALFDRTQQANGMANRVVWVLSRRSKLLPFGGPEPDITPLADRFRAAAEAAKGFGQLALDAEAGRLWADLYTSLCEAGTATTARGPAQTLRLALVYALLDASPAIRLDHLRAGAAVWSYADESARLVFGVPTADPLDDAILAKLRDAHPSGLTRTEISNALNRNVKSNHILAALARLRDQGKARGEREETAGRPRERWFAVLPTNQRGSENRPGTAGGGGDPAEGHNSFVRKFVGENGTVEVDL